MHNLMFAAAQSLVSSAPRANTENGWPTKCEQLIRCAFNRRRFQSKRLRSIDEVTHSRRAVLIAFAEPNRFFQRALFAGKAGEQIEDAGRTPTGIRSETFKLRRILVARHAWWWLGKDFAYERRGQHGTAEQPESWHTHSHIVLPRRREFDLKNWQRGS
jgi:hypothetical protein